MPRRLISQLQRKFGDTKRPQEVIKQKEALAQVGRVARATRDGTQALFQTYYGGRRVASQCPHDLAFKTCDKERRPFVVVVGAGFAGLACAYELAKSQQYNVILVEAGKRVGGRVWSVRQNEFESTITGIDHQFTTVERGGELVGLNHFLWLHYADEFDLHLDYLDPPSNEELGDEETLAGLALLYEYMKLIYIELDEEAAKIDIFCDDVKSSKPWDAPDAKKLDSISLGAFLDTITEKYKNLSEEQVRAKGFTLPKFNFADFETAMAATKSDFENNNGLPCNEQSLYFNLVTIGNGNRNLDPDLLESVFDNIDGIEAAEKARKLSFWEDAELFRCREGNMALAVQFHEHILKEGGQVLLNTAVSDIVVKPNHVKVMIKKGGVVEKLKIPGHKVSKIVLAVPPPVWKHIKITPPLPTTVEPKMGYLVKYLFDVSPEVTKQFKRLDNSTHTQWGMAWEAAKNAPVEDGADKKGIDHTLAVFAGGASAQLLSNPPDADKLGVEAARRKYVFDNLNKMRPAGMEYSFNPASVIRDVYMDWPKHEMVEVGYSCPTVNEVVTLGPLIHGPINGKIVLAGEFACRYKWCGFMEGALISGAGAAKEILKGTEEEKGAKPKNDRFHQPSQRAFDNFKTNRRR